MGWLPIAGRGYGECWAGIEYDDATLLITGFGIKGATDARLDIQIFRKVQGVRVKLRSADDVECNRTRTVKAISGLSLVRRRDEDGDQIISLPLDIRTKVEWR